MTPSDRLISNALVATSCSIVVTDATSPDNPVIYANAAFSELCGYPLAEILGRNCRFLQGSGTDQQTRDDIRAALRAGTGIRREILNYRKDGTPFWNDLTIDPIRDAAGTVTGFIGVQFRADEAHVALEAKAEAESRLASIADNISGYIYQRVMRTDGTVEIVYASPSLRKLLASDRAEPWRNFYEHIHPDDHEPLMKAIRASAANMSVFREEFRLISEDGVTHWLRSDAPPRRMENGEIVWDGLAIEISAEKRWESEIANQALRDPLTGLLTRSAWRDALRAQLNARGSNAARCAVLYIDIEGFGTLNDRLGHSAGDDVLRETARRLADIAAKRAGICGRLGGNEFAVLIPACTDEGVLSAIATATSEGIGVPMQIDRQQVAIRTRIGAALCADPGIEEPADIDSAAELMKQAELALRWSKQEGRSAHVVYSPELDDRFRNQTVLAHSLEQAIADGEFELHYQPLVDLASGRVVSAEALLRWKHPVLGMQAPDTFIPLAEKLGLIVQLGRWVFDHAMGQHRKWREAGLRPLPIAINVSGNQLLDPDFVSHVQTALLTSGASAGDFEIELTEGLLIEPSPQVLETLHALRAMGLTITIDDFGSGHATFRYLRDFPIDKLKLDQIFVRKLVLESTDALIIRAVISLARGMGVAFVAEGIETEMQRNFLLREGCEIGQGYLFSKPLPADAFTSLLADDVGLPLRAMA